MAALPNGSAVPSSDDKSHAIIGINYGNSYASIAVFTKENVAECIANEDGERQIACALSFHGEQVYLGNQAKHQLVKNSQNTIVGFRNLLGKSFTQLASDQLSLDSCPIIQHPTLPDTPAYKVTVSEAPKPSPPLPSKLTSQPSSTRGTPLPPSTPANEPVEVEKYFSVAEVNKIFLSSLVQSAKDFLGRDITGAAISVSSSFTEEQKDALRDVMEKDVGIHVIQILDETSASLAVITSTPSDESNSSSPSSSQKPDRLQLVVDIGQSSLHLSLLSLHSNIAVLLGSSDTQSSTTKGKVGADAIDDVLLKFFSADFVKKTKIPLSLPLPSPPSSTSPPSKSDQRAQTKMLLALEHTKRTISASSGAATCSIESLKDGYDYTGSINRMRFDLLCSTAVYTPISNAVLDLLSSISIDPIWIDEVVYIGGSAALPGLDEHLVSALGLRVEEGDCVTNASGDPTTILARGAALQAALLVEAKDWTKQDEFVHIAKTCGVTIGIRIPGVPEEDGSIAEAGIIPLISKDSPLPARKKLDFKAAAGSDSVKLEVWEIEQDVKVQKHALPTPDYSDDEDVEKGDEEEEEFEEIKYRQWKKLKFLGILSVDGIPPNSQGSLTALLELEGSGSIKLGVGDKEANLTLTA